MWGDGASAVSADAETVGVAVATIAAGVVVGVAVTTTVTACGALLPQAVSVAARPIRAASAKLILSIFCIGYSYNCGALVAWGPVTALAGDRLSPMPLKRCSQFGTGRPVRERTDSRPTLTA